MQTIHQLFNTPGTISLGYNTLEFDDEFLRFSFYRNLLTPYTHQYANHCCRIDIYPMTLMYFLYKPEVITWPTTAEGITSLKLEKINDANHFADGQAHDALTDIEATLGLCKRLASEKEMWEYVSGYFNKKTDSERFLQCDNVLAHHRQALLVQGKFGAKNQFQAPCLHLGDHHHYRNQSVWLRLDDEKLQQTTPESVGETPWVINKKMAEPPFILPMKDRFTQALSSERQATAQNNLQWCQQHPDIFQAIVDYYLNYQHPLHNHVDCSAALYINEFWSNQDTALIRQFHQADWDNKAHILSQLSQPALQTLAARIIAKHDKQLLNNEQQLEYKKYLESIIKPHNPPHDFRGEVHITPDKVRSECKRLKEQHELDKQQHQLLQEIEEYIDNLSSIPL